MVRGDKALQGKVQLALACALVLLSACSRVIPISQPTATVAPSSTPVPRPTIQASSLPFETIEKTDHSTLEAYKGEEPLIVIITETHEVEAVSGWISDEARNELSHLNFEDTFALAVFQGFFTGGEHAAEIQHIVVQGNTVSVGTHFVEPPPNTQLVAIVTSPYHIVKLNREGLHGEYKFVLSDDGNVVQQVDASFP